MNSHGVVRRAQMQVVAKTSTSISLSLKDNEETRSRYPFAFELIISYALDGHTVAQTYEVRNPDTKEKLIFTVGGHPGFNVPLTKGESFEDYYVQFDGDRQPQLVVMTDACFDTGRRTPYHLEEGSILPLKHSLFDIDGLFLTYIDKALTLKSRKSDRFVHMEFPDMNVIGFWHKPSTEAPFLCIEPWHGIPSYDGIVDDFETKQLMIHLAPGKVYTNTVRITVG
jgi:galactose mutarotase-like enzyme